MIVKVYPLLGTICCRHDDPKYPYIDFINTLSSYSNYPGFPYKFINEWRFVIPRNYMEYVI